jgi:hypothetical protein
MEFEIVNVLTAVVDGFERRNSRQRSLSRCHEHKYRKFVGCKNDLSRSYHVSKAAAVNGKSWTLNRKTDLDNACRFRPRQIETDTFGLQSKQNREARTRYGL